MNGLLKIKDTLELWANKHAQIGTVGFGDYYRLDTKTNDYKICWVTPISSRIQGHSETYTMDIMFADLLDDDEKNLSYVWNDCDMIAQDFVATFNTENGDIDDYDYDIRLDENNVNITWFKNLFDSGMAGVFVNVQIVIPLGLNYCKTLN